MPEDTNSTPAPEEIVNLDRPAKPVRRRFKLQKPSESDLKLLKILPGYGVFDAVLG